MYEEAKSREMFARFLKVVRVSLGLSQAQMAGRIGVSRVRYNQYEGGYHLPKQPDRFLVGIKAVITESICERALHCPQRPRRSRLEDDTQKPDSE